MQEVSVSGLSELSTFRVFDKDVAKETEKADRDQARAEANDTEARSAISIFNVIDRAQMMMNSETTEEEKKRYKRFMEKMSEKI